MDRNQNTGMRGATGIIAGIVCLVCCIVGWNARTEASHASALQKRFTSQHIPDKTVALFPLINALATTSHYTAEYFTINTHSGATRHIWIMDCANSKEQGLGHCVWDADTGQLIEVLCLLQTPQSASTALGPHQAVSMAADWLLQLGLQKDAHSWRLASAPNHEQHHWTAMFQWKGQNAYVMLDEKGDLLALRKW